MQIGKEKNRTELGNQGTAMARGKLWSLDSLAHEHLRLNLHYQGHCRRQKTRCIALSSVMKGSCLSWVHLKTECEFLSINQEPSDASRRLRRKPEIRPRVQEEQSLIPSASATSVGNLIAMANEVDLR